MKKLTEEQKREVVEKLRERGVKLPCPRCGNKDFNLLEGYFLQTIQIKLEAMEIGGPAIPSIAAICRNCGYISQHALGVLGLLPKGEIKK